MKFIEHYTESEKQKDGMGTEQSSAFSVAGPHDHVAGGHGLASRETILMQIASLGKDQTSKF